jgi:hypothetical protein
VPVALLSETEARRWGRFGGEPTVEQLDRFFHLDPEDLRWARRRREDATVLGFAVQVGTLRFLGTFLPQVEDTPRGVIAYVARQLGTEPNAWTGYASSRGRRRHTIEIRRLYGYTGFGDGPLHWQFLRWLNSGRIRRHKSGRSGRQKRGAVVRP